MQLLSKRVIGILVGVTVLLSGMGAGSAMGSNLKGLPLKSSFDSLKTQAREKSQNIMVYDENNNIVMELHSDGLEVTYEYENGKMKASRDSAGGVHIYHDKGAYIEVEKFQNGKSVGRSKLAHADEKKPDITPEQRREMAQAKIDTKKKLSGNESDTDNFSTLSLSSYTTYYVNGVLMNDIAVSQPDDPLDKFVRNSMTASQIQSFFVQKNSILKDPVLIYRMTSTGTVYFAGETINAADRIAWAANNYMVNAKVVLATLQKEASLVTIPPGGGVGYSDRRFFYAMGYGATDGGDIQGTSGFDKQINLGTKLLHDLWYEAPISMPVRFDGINYGRIVQSNGVTYQNYIWVEDWGTWALYKYTPHALDVELLPKIGGGNYLFQAIFTGWWGSNWD